MGSFVVLSSLHPDMKPFVLRSLDGDGEENSSRTAAKVGFPSWDFAAMVRRSLEQSEALTDRYHEKAVKSQREGRKAEVRKIMNDHPHLVFDIWCYCRKLVGEKVSCKNKSVPSVEALENGDGGAPGDGGEGHGHGNPGSQGAGAAPKGNLKYVVKLKDRLSGILDRRRMVLELLGLDDLKCVLYHIDEAVFSPWALRGLAPWGAKDASKTNMVETIEFMSGLPGSWKIPKHFEKMNDVVQYVKLQTQEVGDRKPFFTMPLDWKRFGVYEVEPRPEGLMLRNRCSGKTASIEMERFTSKVKDDYEIIDNFSEARATLQQKDVTATVTYCKDIIARAEFKTPEKPSRKRPHALMAADDQAVAGDDGKAENPASGDDRERGEDGPPADDPGPSAVVFMPRVAVDLQKEQIWTPDEITIARAVQRIAGLRSGGGSIKLPEIRVSTSSGSSSSGTGEIKVDPSLLQALAETIKEPPSRGAMSLGSPAKALSLMNVDMGDYAPPPDDEEDAIVVSA